VTWLRLVLLAIALAIAGLLWRCAVDDFTDADFEALIAADPELARELAEALTAKRTSGIDYCPHDPSAKQQAFLEVDAQEALYGGAAGGGKSDALLMAALQYAHVPGYAAILFRRTYTELALPEAIMARSHEWLSSTDATWNGDRKQWRFPSGATLTFGYLDGPRDHLRYQSAAFQFVGWDELTQFPELPYRYLFSRLRKLRGSELPLRVRGATNPGGPGHEWVKARFGIPDDVDFGRIYTHQGRTFVPARRTDNAHLDHATYERALAELDSVSREQLDKGRWVRDTSGLVYSDFSERLVESALPKLPDGERWTYLLACDFGVVDPTAFAVHAFSRHEPANWVVEAEQWPDLSPSEAAEKAIAWGKRYGGFERMIGDVGGLGKAYETEWRKRFHLPLEAAEKQNKLGFIKLLNGDMKAGKLRFVEAGTLELVEHVKTLPWEDETCQSEHPAAPNHLPDALLYGWRAARHYLATERKVAPAVGSTDWWKQQDADAKRQAFAAVRKRLGKESKRAMVRRVVGGMKG
jgi:hypothetical protein